MYILQHRAVPFEDADRRLLPQQTADLAAASGQFLGEQAYRALLRSSSSATAEAGASVPYNDDAASPDRQMPFGRDDSSQQAGMLYTTTLVFDVPNCVVQADCVWSGFYCLVPSSLKGIDRLQVKMVGQVFLGCTKGRFRCKESSDSVLLFGSIFKRTDYFQVKMIGQVFLCCNQRKI